MSKFFARLLSFAILPAFLLVLGGADAARAQVVVTKDLCGPAIIGGGCVIGNGSALPVVAPNTAVAYTFTLSSPTAASVFIEEAFPPNFGFVPQSTTCGPGLPANTSPMYFGPISLPASNVPVTCTISGYFNYLPATPNNANNMVKVFLAADTSHANAVGTSNPVRAVVGRPSTIQSDVSVVKTAQVIASGNGTATVHYTIKVTNSGPHDVFGLQLQDRVTLPSTSIPLKATYQVGSGSCTATGTSACFAPVPSTIISPVFVPSASPVDFVQWSYPAGSTSVLKAGDSMTIEFDAAIDVPKDITCQLVVGGNALINEAHIGFNIPGATTTTFEAMPGNNTSTVSVPIAFKADPDPNCGKPALKISKALTPGQPASFSWPSTVYYDVALQNTSNQPITNVQLFDAVNGTLGDFVSGGIGTPPFSAWVSGVSCAGTICSGTVPAVGVPQPVAGYLNPHWMFGTNVVSVPANTTVTFQLKIEYAKPECDSYPDVKLKPVHNFIRAKYSDPTLGGNIITLQTPPAIALFDAPKPCNFQVTKKVSDGSQKVVFGPGHDIHYDVTYENLNAQPATIGTMIDALRITTPNYASPLTVHYSYTCTATAGVTGFSAPGAPFPIASSGTVQVVPTSLPQQGVRIIQNLAPVSFPPNGKVTCAVTIKVDRPGPVPNCARKGELENAAIMDQSAFYNPNLPWPSNTNPGFADKAALPLPQCFDLVVNKSAKPIWTTPNGGPINYQLTVTNVGDPIGQADGVTLTDTFSPNTYAAFQWTEQCSFNSNLLGNPQPPQCAFGWAPPPTNTTPSPTLNLKDLAHNWGAVTIFDVKGPFPDPYPARPGRICNHAAATVAGLKPDDWYPRDPTTWETDRCVPIFTLTKLEVTKTIQAVAPALPPAATSFIVEANCSLVLNGIEYAPSQTFTFNTPPNPIPSQTLSGVPVGSTCKLVEHALPTAPMPNKGCPSGFAVWGPIQYPKADPKGLVLQPSGNALEVLNSLVCVAAEGTAIVKVCKVAGPGIPVGTPFTFTAGSSTVTVPAGPAPGGTCVIGPSVPVGSTVTVAETLQAGIAVSGIAVAPASRLVGLNLAGGSVNITAGSGVTEVTFTNKKTGYLEICKKGDAAGSFTVNPGGLGPFEVPAGACSPAIEVIAGTVVIQETPTKGTSMTACEAIPAQKVGCNLEAQTATVTVVPGDISTMTIAVITNGKAKDTGSLGVKKNIVAPKGTSLPDLKDVVFAIDVVCTPSGPNTTVNLTADNPSLVIPNIALPTVCKVTEQPLKTMGTCPKPLIPVALPPTYSPDQMVKIAAPVTSASIIVTNQMACVPQGSLMVIKKMATTPGKASPIPPGVQFPVRVTCTPSGPVQTVNLTSAMPSVTLSGLPANSVCTLEELDPVGPIPANCQWAKPTYPIGQDATIPAGSTTEKVVQNQLVCK